MDGMYGCFKSRNSDGVPMASGTADVMEDQECVEASEECSGKKKSKFQTFKKFFARKKRKDTPTSKEEAGLKASQSTDNVSNTAENSTLPRSEKDKGSGSKISLGNKAMSHDSVFVSDSSEANEALGASQDSIHGKVKSLQLQLKQAIRLGSPPSLMCVKKTEDGTMSEDDGLPCSPPEYSAVHRGQVQRNSSVSLEGTDSDDDQLSCAASSRALSPLVVVPGDFSQPASHVVCLDNSAAKYKLGLRHKACNKRKPARRLEMRMEGDAVVEEMMRASSPDALEEREEKMEDVSDDLKPEEEEEEEEVAEQKPDYGQLSLGDKQEEEGSAAKQDLSHSLDSSSPPFLLEEEPSGTQSSPKPSSRASSPDSPRGMPEPPVGQREYLLDPPGVTYGSGMNRIESDLVLGRGGDDVGSNAEEEEEEEEEEESSLLQEVLSSLKTPISSSSLGLEPNDDKLQIEENVMETEEITLTAVGEIEGGEEEEREEAAVDDPVSDLTTQSGSGQTTKVDEIPPLSRNLSSREEVGEEEKDENEEFSEEAEEEECSRHEIYLEGEKEESQEFTCKDEDAFLTGNTDLEEGGDWCKDEQMARDQQNEPETKEEEQEKKMEEAVLEKEEQEKRKEEDVEEEGQEMMVEECVEEAMEQEKMGDVEEGQHMKGEEEKETIVEEHVEEQEEMVREHMAEEEDQEEMGEEHVEEEEEEEQEKMAWKHVEEEEEQNNMAQGYDDQENMRQEHMGEENEYDQENVGEELVEEEEEQEKMGDGHMDEENEQEKNEEDVIEEDVEELQEGKEKFEETLEEEKTAASPVAVGEVLPSTMSFHEVDEFARVASSHVRLHVEPCDGALDIQMSDNQSLRDEMSDGEEDMGSGIQNHDREEKIDQEAMEAEQVDVDEEAVKQDMEKMESNQDEMYVEKGSEDVEETARKQAQSSFSCLLEPQLHDETRLQESETSSSYSTTTAQINLVSPRSGKVPSLLQVSCSPEDPSEDSTHHVLEGPEQTTDETVGMVEEQKQSTDIGATVVEETTPVSSPTAPVKKLLKHSSNSLDQGNARFSIAPAWQRSLSTGDASLKESVTAASPSSPSTWISPSTVTMYGGTDEPSIGEKDRSGKSEPVSSGTVELVLSPGRKKNVNIVPTKPHIDPPAAHVKPQSTTPQESSVITEGNPENLFGVRLRKTAVQLRNNPEEENTELVFESSAQPVSIKPALPKKPELHCDSRGKNKSISDSSVVRGVSVGSESPSWISVAKQKQRIYKETSMEDIKVTKVEPERTSSLPWLVDLTECSKTPEPASRVSPLETKTPSPLEEDVNPTCSPSAPVPVQIPKSQLLHSPLSSNAQVSPTTSKYPTQLYATRRSMSPATPVPVPQRSLSLTSQLSSTKSATSPEPQSSPLTSPSFSQRVTPVHSGPTPSGAPLPSIQTSSSHRGQPLAPMPQDEPPWMALAKKKAKAWSEMPQIIQ